MKVTSGFIVHTFHSSNKASGAKLSSADTDVGGFMGHCKELVFYGLININETKWTINKLQRVETTFFYQHVNIELKNSIKKRKSDFCQIVCSGVCPSNTLKTVGCVSCFLIINNKWNDHQYPVIFMEM